MLWQINKQIITIKEKECSLFSLETFSHASDSWSDSNHLEAQRGRRFKNPGNREEAEQRKWRDPESLISLSYLNYPTFNFFQCHKCTLTVQVLVPTYQACLLMVYVTCNLSILLPLSARTGDLATTPIFALLQGNHNHHRASVHSGSYCGVAACKASSLPLSTTVLGSLPGTDTLQHSQLKPSTSID